MAKLPLLFQFKPSVGVGPTVMLAQGRYSIESNHKDSDLRLALGGSLLLFQKDIEVDEDTKIQVAIVGKGTEIQLTVYAVSQ